MKYAFLVLAFAYSAAFAAAPENIRLPVSKTYVQGGTNLCWVYATMSAIESNFMKAHPGMTLELSRSAMQVQQWRSRYTLALRGVETNLVEGGSATDAIRLARESGLFPYPAFKPSPKGVEPKDPFRLRLTEDGAAARLERLLSFIFGDLPTRVQWKGFAGTPPEFAKFILGDQVWENYGISVTEKIEIKKHWDRDARADLKAVYLPRALFNQVIVKSLRNGHALVGSFEGKLFGGPHAVEIYGVELDASGNAQNYLIKNSQGRSATDAKNLMKLSASKFNSDIRGLTTIRLPEFAAVKGTPKSR